VYAESEPSGAPLISGTAAVPEFNKDALIKALRTDQAGKSSFPEFLAVSWRAESSVTMWISAGTIQAIAGDFRGLTRLSPPH
jgi:hypothetical protein